MTNGVFGLPNPPSRRPMGANKRLISASAYDDEFDANSLGRWNLLYPQFAARLDIHTTVASHFFLNVPATREIRWVGIYRRTPAPRPLRITTRLSDCTSVVDWNMAGLFVAEETPGRMFSICCGATSHGDLLRLRIERWPSPVTGVDWSYSAGISTGRPPIYFRIVVEQNNVLGFFYSLDGLTFSPIYLGIHAGFTIGAFGLAAQPIHNNIWQEAAFDWVRCEF